MRRLGCWFAGKCGEAKLKFFQRVTKRDALFGAADFGAVLMERNVVPIGEFGVDAVEGGAVAGQELAERLVGLVMLDDLDVPAGPALLGQ